MELIPILSLIILVATISTFILAVGAYVLYKIRERKGKNVIAERPDTIEAELVTPTKVVAETRTTRGATTGEPIYTRSTRSETRYTTVPRETRDSRAYSSRRETRKTRPAEVTRYVAPKQGYTNNEGERYTSPHKFKRYTNPHDEQPVPKEVKKEESLRWR